jgi:hypothetical protein
VAASFFKLPHFPYCCPIRSTKNFTGGSRFIAGLALSVGISTKSSRWATFALIHCYPRWKDTRDTAIDTLRPIVDWHSDRHYFSCACAYGAQPDIVSSPIFSWQHKGFLYNNTLFSYLSVLIRAGAIIDISGSYSYVTELLGLEGLCYTSTVW